MKMDGAGRIWLLFATLIVPLLSLAFFTEYCPAVSNFGLQWPRIARGKNITNDCSAINSSWTGKLTARCMKNAAGNVTWNYLQGCGCELQTVLLHYQTQASQVNMANFLEIVKKLENAYKDFINQKIYLALLSTVKNSTCKRRPLRKSAEWDKIQKYCQMRPDDFWGRILSDHFKKQFCQKIATATSNLHTGLVITSYEGSRPKPNAEGEANVELDESSSQDNRTQMVNDTLASVTSGGCTVTSYYMVNGTLVIKAKPTLTTTDKHRTIKERLEMVLISISLVAIICSLTILSCLRIQSAQNSEKLFVHKSLLISWALGYAVYIADVIAFNNRKEWIAACTAIAVVRHFFQTAVFTWMLVEAVNLFIKLVKVISAKTFYMTYLAIGWGIPALIVGITTAARTKTYDMSQDMIEDIWCGSIKFAAKVERTSCWLNGSKWLYTGPVFAILLVNLVFFVILLKVVFGKVATKYSNDQMMKTRKGLKSVAALLPLLGVTWLFGLIIEFHEGIVFCIFHCILDEQVRRTISRKVNTTIFIHKNVSPGRRGNDYTITRPAKIEMVKKRKLNETMDI